VLIKDGHIVSMDAAIGELAGADIRCISYQLLKGEPNMQAGFIRRCRWIARTRSWRSPVNRRQDIRVNQQIGTIQLAKKFAFVSELFGAI
jgi:hypothetical protein